MSNLHAVYASYNANSTQLMRHFFPLITKYFPLKAVSKNSKENIHFLLIIASENYYF